MDVMKSEGYIFGPFSKGSISTSTTRFIQPNLTLSHLHINKSFLIKWHIFKLENNSILRILFAGKRYVDIAGTLFMGSWSDIITFDIDAPFVQQT